MMTKGSLNRTKQVVVVVVGDEVQWSSLCLLLRTSTS